MACPSPAHPSSSWPAQPVLVELWRGRTLESVHRGAWAVVDTQGRVVRGAGDLLRLFPARSAVKCLQALPLVESGAAEAAGYDSADLALALSSHNGEEGQTTRVLRTLDRLDLSVAALQCGAQEPGDPAARRALKEQGLVPTALHNNCSGKHTGFLARSRFLGEDPSLYLSPDSRVQSSVRQAVADLCGRTRAQEVSYEIDGCSAPSWLISVAELGRAFAQVGSPDGLSLDRARACQTLTAAAAAHPGLIAGRHKRMCTHLLEASEGRLFPKIGAEGIYGIALREQGLALALKMEDGQSRGLYSATLLLLRELGWLAPEKVAPLLELYGPRAKNWAGQEVLQTRLALGE